MIGIAPRYAPRRSPPPPKPPAPTMHIVTEGGTSGLGLGSLILLILAWVALLALPRVGLPAEPAPIDGPAAAAPGDLVVLRATVEAKGYAWTAVPDSKKWLAIEGGKQVVFATRTPGVYTFVLATAADPSKPVIAQHVVTIAEEGPNPNPQPGPGPQPQPTPGQRIAHLVIVEETSQRTPAQAKALTSQTVRQSLAAKGIQWHLLDKDQTNQPWAAAYVRLAGAQLPRCIAVDSDDRVVEQFALPSEAALLEWIAKQKGTK